MPNHGEFAPGKGWYSQVDRAWHDKSSSIGVIMMPSDANAESKRAEFERMNTRRSFDRDEQMDLLIKLRDSDRLDDRQRYEKVITPQIRMALDGYQKDRTAADESGEL